MSTRHDNERSTDHTRLGTSRPAHEFSKLTISEYGVTSIQTSARIMHIICSWLILWPTQINNHEPRR